MNRLAYLLLPALLLTETLGQARYEVRYKLGLIDTRVVSAEITWEESTWNGIPAYYSAAIIETTPFFRLFLASNYFAETYFDYGSYISVRDYYYGGNASVTYLVPKKVEDNIFELTKNDNIFEENPKYKKYAGAADSESYKEFKINLKTPKFNLKSDVDFRPCLESLGFGSIFDRHADSFKNAFSGEAVKDKTTWLQTLKQRNEVEFNEDGSIVRSVSMAGMACGEAAPMQPDGTLDVDLNQPFIYIIRDINDNPIFVGHVDNPRA